jgi:ankyrin repeat protein
LSETTPENLNLFEDIAQIMREFIPDSIQDEKFNLLHCYATLGATDELIMTLATGDIDVNAGDKNGAGPLTMAILSNNFDIVRLLLAVDGIDLNIQDAFGKTPLHYASEFQYANSVLKDLIAFPGIQLNLPDILGDTPLLSALRRGAIINIKTLLQVPGVDVNVANQRNYTSLHFASIIGSYEIVEDLLGVDGINADTTNLEGLTALDLAKLAHKEYLNGYQRDEEVNEEYEKVIAALEAYKSKNSPLKI